MKNTSYNLELKNLYFFPELFVFKFDRNNYKYA